jgi:hypothetical protein
MRTNEKGTMGGMIDTEMWENRMNLEIHECGNASVERECGTQVNRGGEKIKMAAHKKKRERGNQKKKLNVLKKLA